MSILAASTLAWVLSSLRTRAEIRKLRTETIKLAGENLKHEQTSRKEYSIACNDCKNASLALYECIVSKKSATEILNAREKLCDSFTTNAITLYASYVEWQCMALYEEKERILDFIEQEVALEIQRFCEWRDIINLPIEKLGLARAPLRVQKRSLRAFYEINRFVPKSQRAQIDQALKGKLQELEK